MKTKRDADTDASLRLSQSCNCNQSMTQSPMVGQSSVLHRLPPELVDMVLRRLPTQSLLRLSQTYRPLRRISTLCYEVGLLFRTLLATVFPCAQFPASLAPLSPHVRRTLTAFAQLLNRFNGSATITACSKSEIRALAPVLPSRVHILVPVRIFSNSYLMPSNPFHVPETFFEVIAQIPGTIPSLQFEDELVDSGLADDAAKHLPTRPIRTLKFKGSIPKALIDVLHSFVALETIEITDPNAFPLDALASCKRLWKLIIREDWSCNFFLDNLDSINSSISLPGSLLTEIVWIKNSLYLLDYRELMEISNKMKQLGWKVSMDKRRDKATVTMRRLEAS
ncbi:hypothetical protein BC830DRAFT_1153690, partial [Chytriomyces sp. MP71]